MLILYNAPSVGLALIAQNPISLLRSFSHLSVSLDKKRASYQEVFRDGKSAGIKIGVYDYDKKDHIKPMDHFAEVEANKIKDAAPEQSDKDPFDEFLSSRHGGRKGSRSYDMDHHTSKLSGLMQQKESFALSTGINFLQSAKILRKGPKGPQWVQFTLPSIHAKSFVLLLANTIAQLEENKAFAAHFIAGGPMNTYVSLGPSMIITRQSDPYEILTHLKELARFYEESYDIKFDNYLTLRVRDLGDSSNLTETYYRTLTEIQPATGPWGTVNAAAALPFPNFDFLGMLTKYEDEINSYADREVGLKHLSSYALDGIRLAVYSDTDLTFKLPDGAEIHYRIEKTAPEGTKFGPGIPYSYTTAFYVNASEKLYIPFNDTEMDEGLISRNVRGINIHIDRATGNVVGSDHSFGPRRFISTAKPSRRFSGLPENIVAADIEALIHNRTENIPYAAAYFTHDAKGREIYRVFKWQDYKLDSFKLLYAFWESIATHAVGKTIYFHNWNGYDAFHALNPLVHLAQKRGWFLRPILRNGKIINMKVYGSGKNAKLLFDIKDSILLIPGGLGGLAKAFGLSQTKEHFPHYFDVLQISHSADYVGPWPNYSDFEPKRTSLDDYLELVKETPTFDFMGHTLKYLKLDVVLLHQILVAYFKEIHEEFKVDARKNMSIPGVAFKTWKSTQLPALIKSGSNTEIYDFSTKYDSFFREAYLGGIVDVYRPRVTNGFYYDVNSLYPTAMLKALPVGRPVFQILSVRMFLESDWFGFIHATVTAPANMHIGYLSIRRDGKLITPNGTFSGTWFSEEVRFALARGYTLVSIAYGYAFNQSTKVFDGFINNLATMKIEAEKAGLPAKRNIAKLLMNSSYGRFGMHPNTNVSTIVSESDAIKIHRGFDVSRSIPFTNGYELIEYNPVPDVGLINLGFTTLDEVQPFTELNEPNNETNVPLAAAITAHSRMIINSYKYEAIQLGIDVIYSDTDSLVVNREVPADWLHPTTFGKFKLEHIIKEGYFIAPKLYYLEAVDAKTGKTYSVSKSRGYNGKLDLAQIQHLYRGNTLKLQTMKWYRDWHEHTVSFNMESPLEITGQFSKRVKVYNALGDWVNTRAITYNESPVSVHKIKNIPFDNKAAESYWRIQRVLMYRNRPMRTKAAFRPQGTK